MGKEARKADVDDASKDEFKITTKGIKMEGRHCTDIMCCLVFFVFFLGMAGISGLAISKGDPLKIMTPYDSDGNQCGLPE